MKTREESVELARLMVDIGKRAGKRISALITDMDRPLGNTVGNTVEVVEAIETLMGSGPEDLTALCVELATKMLVLADRGDEETCRANVLRVLKSGEALERLADMVEAQGGDRTWATDPTKFPRAAYSHSVCAPASGYITHVNAEEYGKAALLLGAGRNTKEDAIDHKAGIRLLAKTGDSVKAGEPIALLYASDPALFESASRTLLDATEIGAHAPMHRPLIFDVID
jgi:pyrimidine-nucleoside phosphorylase